MPYKDQETAREWHRNRKAKIRAELRRIPLHRQLGIETYVHRQAVLDDPRMGRRFDTTSRSWNGQHTYRENITLARVS